MSVNQLNSDFGRDPLPLVLLVLCDTQSHRVYFHHGVENPLMMGKTGYEETDNGVGLECENDCGIFLSRTRGFYQKITMGSVSKLRKET